MPRRHVVEKRQIKPDTRYKSVLITQFVNSIMRDGNKSLALNIVYGAFDQLAQRFKDHFIREGEEQDHSTETNNSSTRASTSVSYENIPIVVFNRALENIQPLVEVKSSRIGGSTYRVPKPAITPKRRRALAFSFLKKAALNRKAHTTFQAGDRAMSKLLALEIADAYENKGGAVKMRSDLHRSAKANQAYVQVQFQSPQELKL